MANAAPPTTPSMRKVRDKYLNLLLSDTPPAHPSRPWTPHHNAPPPWASPVTPLSESDVRLAELAAGLVAAGSAEARQTATIRRLASQLEHSEQRVKALEESATPVKHGKHAKYDKHSKHDGDDKHDKRSARRSGRVETKRQIRFTPARPTPAETPRRDSARRSARLGGLGGLGGLARLGGGEREELERLRRERDEWERLRGKEERRLSALFADIKKNTQRLLAERADHLGVIERLQARLEGGDELSPAPGAAVRWEGEARSPRPVVGDSAARGTRAAYEREASPASVRHLDFEDDECRDGGLAGGRRGSATGGVQQSVRECELREELSLVLLENEQLSERVAVLEAAVAAGLHEQGALHGGGGVTRAADGDRAPTATCIVSGMEALVEEVQVLEGVAEAINFGTTPSEADALQDTTTLGLSADDRGASSSAAAGRRQAAHASTQAGTQAEGGRAMSQADVVEGVVSRLKGVRVGLLARYGAWLIAVGNDESLGEMEGVMGVAEDESMGSGAGVETMDTQAIERIIGGES